MSHYIHHVPGRLRITTLQLKRNETRAKEVCRLLSSIDGVLDCQVKTITGSAVISYDADVITAGGLIAFLKKHGLVTAEAFISAPQNDANLTQAVVKAGGNVGKVVIGVVLEKALERSAVALIGALL
jgi:Heavy metal associated domain 2